MIMNPNSIDFDMAPDKEMFSYHKRIETFKEWPHTDCNCTPEKVIIIRGYFLAKLKRVIICLTLIGHNHIVSVKFTLL